MITILTIHMKGIKQIEKITILKHKSCKGEIQRYTRPPKISPEPVHDSTLPNSLVELFYFYILRAGSNSDEEDMS